MTSSQEQHHDSLPPKPIPPLPTDCCGSGCTPCVNDLYEDKLSHWLRLSSMTASERSKWYKENERGLNQSSDHRPALSRESFQDFEIIAIQPLTPDSFLYSFALPENHVLGTGIGQHAVLQVEDVSGKLVSRQYTPVSPINQTGHFDVAIKLYRDGEASRLIQHWKVGILTKWKGPFGGFSYSSNKYRKLVMLACGSGIAPFIQLIRHIVENEDDYTQIVLFYSIRTQKDILLKNILDSFKEYWNFTVKYILSRSSPELLETDKGLVKYGDHVKFGRINETMIAKELHDNNYFLICGTKSFTKDMSKILLHIGQEWNQIFMF